MRSRLVRAMRHELNETAWRNQQIHRRGRSPLPLQDFIRGVLADYLLANDLARCSREELMRSYTPASPSAAPTDVESEQHEALDGLF